MPQNKTAIEHTPDNLAPGEGAEAEKPVYTRDGTIRDNTVAKDSFEINDRKRELYGVPDGYTPRWVRDPNHRAWAGFAEDRISDTMDAYPGAFPAAGKGKEVGTAFVKKGDLVLMCIPTEQVEQFQAEIDEASAEWQSNLFETELRPGVKESDIEYEFGENDELIPSDQAHDKINRKRKVAMMRQYHAQQGMVGGNSVTQGMSLSEAYARFSTEEIEAEASRYREGRTYNPMTAEQFRDSILMAGRDAATRPRGRRSYGMGDNGFPNPLQKKAAAGK